MNSPTETALQTGPPERRRTPFVHYGVNNFYDIHDKSYNVSLAYIFNKNKTRNQKNTQRNNNIPCMPHQQNACRGLALSRQEMIMSKTALYPCFMFICIVLISFRKHTIGASYMDMFFGVENTPLYPRNIPDVSTFQINARGSAVNKGDHVVIYENTGMFGYFMGARAWWMFKVLLTCT